MRPLIFVLLLCVGALSKMIDCAGEDSIIKVLSLGSGPINLVHSAPIDLHYEQEIKRWNYW